MGKILKNHFEVLDKNQRRYSQACLQQSYLILADYKTIVRKSYDSQKTTVQQSLDSHNNILR